MENLYLVIRKKGNVVVSIMYNRLDGTYHFVNLTKGHICERGFETVFEAIGDMEIKKENGEIIDFVRLDV